MISPGRIGNSFDGRNHHRHVFRFAAGENGVDRHLLCRDRNLAFGNEADHLVGSQTRGLEHLGHTRLGWRHDRQTVAPVLTEAEIDRVTLVCDTMPTGKEF
jgi:hypothetical protein